MTTGLGLDCGTRLGGTDGSPGGSSGGGITGASFTFVTVIAMFWLAVPPLPSATCTVTL